MPRENRPRIEQPHTAKRKYIAWVWGGGGGRSQDKVIKDDLTQRRGEGVGGADE